MAASLSVVFRRFSFVSEIGNNAGAWVQFFQRFCYGKIGDSWCADIESMVEDIAYYGRAPTPRSGSCQVKYTFCKNKGWLVTEPEVDDLFFFVNDGHAHHIGVVTYKNPLMGIAGNTNRTGDDDNGQGVHEHKIVPPKNNIVVYARLPK
jgi:hypothetical protein